MDRKSGRHGTVKEGERFDTVRVDKIAVSPDNLLKALKALIAEPGLEGMVQIDPTATGSYLYRISGEFTLPNEGERTVPLATLTLIETSYVLEAAPVKFGYEYTPESGEIVEGAKLKVKAVLSRYI